MAFQSVPRKVAHYTQVLDPRPDDPCFREWWTWKAEMPRLLKDGYEGKFIVIKGSKILGPYETLDEARDAAHAAYPLQSFVMMQILEYEPVLNVPAVYHGSYGCPTSR